ncbi:MAG: branched-chain-amino-acid transaminase [Verrucomicrobiales bacterium]|jgi:branched-chain amino acid aminotransferase|nr:branched-chain-amino-acid transaminase [Verrucomicrobiales bacterium]|tara:strand:+ start:18787 stop:19671 length:885 start_codon:yes stop_codon:yes gene_type:complete
MNDKPLQVYIDGEFFDESDAKISVFDHGLLYGDGIFEGIRFYNDRVTCLEEHIDRLFDSAKAIHLEIPSTREEVGNTVIETIKRNQLHDGYVRLVVTRGTGGLGLSPYRCEKASIIVIASTISLYPQEKYEKGLILSTCATRRPTHDSLSPSVKSLNYLSNVMAKVEALASGAEEGVMLNTEGYVAECTGDNIFVVKDDVILTPTVASGSLNGITRRVVIDLAIKANFELKEIQMSRYDMYTADELFLTGTAAEVVPVAQYDKRIIGEGKPGPVTRQLIADYRNLVETTGTPIY